MWPTRWRRPRGAFCRIIIVCSLILGPIVAFNTFGLQILFKMEARKPLVARMETAEGQEEGKIVLGLLYKASPPYMNISTRYDNSPDLNLPVNIENVFLGKAGFFLEVGSGKGQDMSLWMDLYHKWEGLIVEPENNRFRELQGMRRRVSLLHACVKILNRAWCNDPHEFSNRTFQGVPLVSIKSIVQAIGRKEIELLVVNIQGGSEEFLQEFPFDVVAVSVVVVNIHNTNPDTQKLITIMKKHGYSASSISVNQIMYTSRIFFTKSS